MVQPSAVINVRLVTEFPAVTVAGSITVDERHADTGDLAMLPMYDINKLWTPCKSDSLICGDGMRFPAVQIKSLK